MNLDLLKKIAKLGSLGYAPDNEVPVVRMTTNAPDDSISHIRPKEVLVCDSGTSYIDARIMHELEQDLAALISAAGIRVDNGRPLHELVPLAAERIGIMDEFYAANYTQEEPTEEPKEEDEGDQPLTD